MSAFPPPLVYEQRGDVPIEAVCKCLGSSFVIIEMPAGKKGPMMNPRKLTTTALAMILGMNQKSSCMTRPMAMYTNIILRSPSLLVMSARTIRPRASPPQKPEATYPTELGWPFRTLMRNSTTQPSPVS